MRLERHAEEPPENHDADLEAFHRWSGAMYCGCLGVIPQSSQFWSIEDVGVLRIMLSLMHMVHALPQSLPNSLLFGDNTSDCGRRSIYDSVVRNVACHE
jgi:hypothetical protein